MVKWTELFWQPAYFWGKDGKKVDYYSVLIDPKDLPKDIRSKIFSNGEFWLEEIALSRFKEYTTFSFLFSEVNDDYFDEWLVNDDDLDDDDFYYSGGKTWYRIFWTPVANSQISRETGDQLLSDFFAYINEYFLNRFGKKAKL